MRQRGLNKCNSHLFTNRFAVEASESIKYAKILVEANNFKEKIKLINKRIEDIDEDEIGRVDTIISEPLGILLINERMLETYLLARDKYNIQLI